MTKPSESIPGTVQMADGTWRGACKNTYTETVFKADGSFAHVQVVRIEFRLFTNANAGGPKYRKTTDKQAATFRADS
jgi:hypothetical protein